MFNTPDARSIASSTISRRGALIAGGATLAAAAAAPALGAARSIQPERGIGRAGGRALEPASYRFRVGELECLSIADGTMQMPIKPLWAPEATEEQVKQALRDEFLPDTSVTAYVNIMVIKSGKEVVVVDTGTGAGAGMFLPRLSAAGVEPASVTAVIITHMHGDHFGGLLTGGTPTFPNAAVFINGAERDFWMKATPDDIKNAMPAERKQGSIDSARKTLDGVGKALQALKPGAAPLDFVTLVDLPGHTPGHVGLRVAGGKESLLHFADTAHHHAIMVPHPEWTVMFDTDAPMAKETRKKLFAQAASERTRLYSYHLPWPGIGHLKTEGQGYRWVAEPWMFT